MGMPKARQGKKIGNCTLAHFPEIECRNFAENQFYFELQEITVQKKIWQRARGSPL